MPAANIGTIQLYYEVRGQGEPLVLIPGFAAGSWIWFKQAESLARNFRVITFDPRGVSRSARPAGPQSIQLLADDLAELLRAIRVEAGHIVGASFGGFVAQQFALSYPRTVKSLILCCTSYGGPGHVLPSAETLNAISSTKGLNSEARMRENLLLAFSPDFIKDSPDEIEEVIRLRTVNDVPEHIYLAQLQAALAFNSEVNVRDLRIPTLVISGDKDVIVPVANSRNLAAAIPGAKLRILRNGSHTFFIERAEEFNSIVTQFINRPQMASDSVSG